MTQEWILKKLKESGLKLTKPRLAVIELLDLNKEKFFSVDDIFKKLEGTPQACDLTSIYRTLTSLEENGIVERGDFFGEASRYRIMQHHDNHHHHHHYFKCTSCEAIEVLCGDCNVSSYEENLAKKGYSQLSHRLELSGLCPKCS